jgi:hypothetical protein
MAYFIFGCVRNEVLQNCTCQSVKLAETTLKSLIHVTFRAFLDQHSLNVHSSENPFRTNVARNNEVQGRSVFKGIMPNYIYNFIYCKQIINKVKKHCILMFISI